MSGNEIRHSVCAELQISEVQQNKLSILAERLFNKQPYSHLESISKIENPIKRAFYDLYTQNKKSANILMCNIFTNRYKTVFPHFLHRICIIFLIHPSVHILRRVKNTCESQKKTLRIIDLQYANYSTAICEEIICDSHAFSGL